METCKEEACVAGLVSHHHWGLRFCRKAWLDAGTIGIDQRAYGSRGGGKFAQ
jgi:hypothetical protein